MRRGAKAGLSRLALEVRGELGHDANSVLDPVDLAAEYGVPIYRIGDAKAFGCPAGVIEYFAGSGLGNFSAALVPTGRGRFIIENDFHALTRRRSSLAHEMSHVLLEHEFAGAILGPDGCRAMEKEDEEQADWLAGELLIPTDTARRLGVKGMSDQAVANHYGISPKRAAMRLNLSGGRLIANRSGTARRH